MTELEVVKKGYCGCAASHLCGKADKLEMELSSKEKMNYVIVKFGKTPPEDEIWRDAGSSDVVRFLAGFDTKELCHDSNRTFPYGVLEILSGKYSAVTLRDMSKEKNNKENGRSFYFFSKYDDSQVELPLYRKNSAQELEVHEFADNFKNRITKFYESLACRKTSRLADTSCVWITNYVELLLEGKGHETAFHEEELFGSQLGVEKKKELIGEYGEKEIGEKEKFKNSIISQLQKNLIAAYKDHEKIKEITSEKDTVLSAIDIAIKYLGGKEDALGVPIEAVMPPNTGRPLEKFLHAYQIAYLKLLKEGTDFSFAGGTCDAVGGEEHYALHRKEDDGGQRKVLVTGLRVKKEEPGMTEKQPVNSLDRILNSLKPKALPNATEEHLANYLAKHREHVDALVLFEVPW